MSTRPGNGPSDDLLSRLSELIAEKTALNFPRDRWNDLERRAGAAAEEFGFGDPAEFVRWLLSSPLTGEQLDILASHLTISETYFWREPRVFEALVNYILPEMIRSKANGPKTLRFWSAGCASGEEPYSIAMAVRQVMPDLKDWRVSILATDLNQLLLKKAKAGVFGEWSFRNAPPWLGKYYFLPRKDEKYEVRPEIRTMVDFRYLNLAEDAYPSSLTGAYGMDVIFCRNVLMYFAPDRAKTVREGLNRSLVEGGWLIVGASELSFKEYSRFRSIHLGGAIVYRKVDEKVGLPAKAPIEEAPPAFQFSEPEAAPPHELAPVIAPVARAPEKKAVEKIKVVAQPATPAITVRALANQGRLAEALAACEEALAAEKLDAELYYLRAIILQERNLESEAIASFKQAIYIEPNFVPAHFSLGSLLLRGERKRAALKYFDNVLKILSTYQREDVLPEFEGLTAGRLMEIVRATIQIGA